jgi:SAM-dependent methyltransferase
MAPGFDEAAYLDANPTVRAQVEQGTFASGWDHFLEHGSRESRAGVASSVARVVVELNQSLDRGTLEPVPPAHLRVREHGSADSVDFERVGRAVATTAYLLASSLPDFRRDGEVLDFGSRTGRVLRYITKLLPDARFLGVDIDREAIAWSREHLAHLGAHDVNDPAPPLHVPPDRFDVVLAISVFSHLPASAATGLAGRAGARDAPGWHPGGDHAWAHSVPVASSGRAPPPGPRWVLLPHRSSRHARPPLPLPDDVHDP